MTKTEAIVVLLKRLVELTGYPETPEEEREVAQICKAAGIPTTKEKIADELVHQLNKVHAAGYAKMMKEH